LGIFKKINFGLRKTRNNMSGAIDNVLDSYTSIDEELFDELEEALVMGDVGVTTASEITKRLNERVRKKGLKDPSEVKTEIKEIVAEMLEGGEDISCITVTERDGDFYLVSGFEAAIACVFNFADFIPARLVDAEPNGEYVRMRNSL
jgi:signal recognition particle GTPase